MLGNGVPASSTGPALSSGINRPFALMVHPTKSSVLVTDISGVRELTLSGFLVRDPPPAQIDFSFPIASAITTTVALAISATLGANILGSIGGSIGSSVSAVQTGSASSFGSSALSLIFAVQ